MLRYSFAILAATSLAAAPVAAQAATPASLPTQAERAGAEPGDQDLVGRGGMGSSWLVPGLVLLAVIVGAILLLDDDEEPESP